MPTPSGNFGLGELDEPTGLAITDSILYAANFNNSRAEVYDITVPGAPVRINEFGAGELSGPQGMVIYLPSPIFPPSPCYVANMNNNTISIYDVTFPPGPVRVGQISSHLRAPVGLAIFFHQHLFNIR